MGSLFFTPNEMKNKYWEWVKHENTLEAYILYLDSYPGGKFMEEAHWEIACFHNDGEAYNKYITIYPEGLYFPQAAKKLKDFSKNEEQFAEAYNMAQEAYQNGDYKLALRHLRTAKLHPSKNQAEAQQLRKTILSENLSLLQRFWLKKPVRYTLFSILLLTAIYCGSQIHIPRDPYIDRDFVWVEGGTFMMGKNKINEDTNIDEHNQHPSHLVTVDGFFMGKNEVTQKQWRNVMGNWSFPEDPNYRFCDNCPVANINWFEANAFVDRLNRASNHRYRLPTEAEWEYAARGGEKADSTLYAGSNNVFEVGWFWRELRGHYVSTT